jgi:hypothetical protein
MGIRKSYIILLALLAFPALKSQGQLADKEYRVALLLPFKSADAGSNNLSEAMLDYYEGFKTAAMILEAEGLHLKLYVFDSEKDSFALENALSHPDMPSMDIIVGPVYEKGLETTEKFCKKHNILLVSPLKYFEPQYSKGNVVNFFVPDSVKLLASASKSVSWFPKHKFIVVSGTDDESKSMATTLLQELRNTHGIKAQSMTYSNGKLSGTIPYKDSVIILTTASARDAKSVIARAIKYQAHSYLFAHVEWHNPSQSTYNVNEPRVIYPEVNYVSLDDSLAAQFRNSFFESYAGEPSKFAYIGYDQATYLCYGLMTFGRNFVYHLPNAEYRGYINMIRLRPLNRGFANFGLNYLQIVDEERKEFAP